MGADHRVCLALGVALIAAPATASADCSSDGTRAFRTEGVDAALAAFAEARGRAECRDDAQLAFNYARSVQTVLDRDGDDERACDAAGAYGQAATVDGLPGAVRALAAKGRAEMADRCEALRRAAAPTEDYETLVDRARGLVRGGDKAGAAESWKAASRLKPDAALPHRALCSLLPDLDRASEGRGHCRQWRALEPATATVPAAVAPAPDHTLTWVVVGASVAAVVGGGLLYGEALSAADDADGAYERAAAARDADDPQAYDRAGDDFDAAVGRAERAQIGAFAVWGVGAALAGWTAWRLLDGGGSGATVYTDGRGVGLYGRF